MAANQMSGCRRTRNCRVMISLSERYEGSGSSVRGGSDRLGNPGGLNTLVGLAMSNQPNTHCGDGQSEGNTPRRGRGLNPIRPPIATAMTKRGG